MAEVIVERGEWGLRLAGAVDEGSLEVRVKIGLQVKFCDKYWIERIRWGQP